MSAPNRGHKLLTKALRTKLLKAPTGYNLSSEDLRNAPVVAKFFSPYSGHTWYCVSADEREDGDLTIFGYVVGPYPELGDFSFNELDNAAGMGGRLPLVERDCYFDKHTLGDFLPPVEEPAPEPAPHPALN